MKRTRQFFSVLLTLAMLLSLLPTTALAAGIPDPTSVLVDGGKSFLKPSKLYYKNGNESDNFTGTALDYNAHYDPDNGILTLKDYDGGQIMLGGASQDALTIKLIGDNKITVNGGWGIGANGHQSSITITADSSSKLTINVTSNSGSDSAGIDNCYGSGTSGDVTIKGYADVTINTTTKRGGYGIYAKNVVIEDYAKVATTVNAPSNTGGGLVYGIFAKTNVTINTAGEIMVDVSNAGTGDRVYSTGVNSQNTLTLTKVGGMTVKWNSNLSSRGGPLYPVEEFDSTAYDNIVDTTNCIATYMPKVALPTAAVDNVTIDGTTGTAIADKEVIITLANDTFASTLSGSWITNLPAGLSQSVSRTDDTHAKITVSGNPSAVSSDALIIKIPAASLASGSDLDVTGNANAKYNIKASVAALGGSAGITGTAKYNEILTADTSAITGNTGTFLYQWKRNGTDIPGAKNSTYKIVTEDIGKTITVAISSSVESGTIVSPATATVGKADTPSAPTGLSGITGQPLSTVTLPGGWTWADGTTVMNTAGTQTFKANYTDAAGNYENATNVDVTVNVTAKSTAALTGLTQSGCTYGETLSAPSYTKPAGTIDSTIKVTYMGKGGTTYAESATKPVKAGNYTVKVTLETADTIYSGTADFTIAQKDVTIRGFKVTNSAYNGDTKTSFDKTAAEIVGKITGDDVTIDTTAAEANFAQKDVGNDIPVNFTGVKLAGADKDNYRISSVEPAKANIYQRTLTVKPDSGLSKKYGEADPALSSTVSGTIYGEMYIIDGKLEREAGENVGNYKILLGTLALKDNGAFKASNYILSLDTTAVYFEIKKAPAPSAPTGLSGMKGKTLSTVPLTGGWAWADGTTVMNTAGTQIFKANYTDTTGNYENATNVDVTVEVIDKTNVSASITFADGKLTYNGAGQAYETASISGITAGANPG